MSKKYNRYFLIFNEEDKGFEVASDKQPTGYTKIETKSGKCKITVYAQNLKAEKGPYVCYLVDSSKNPAKVAKLGEFLVDETGKGETVWEHDSKNISGTGLSSDRFNVAAVVKEGNRLQVPLAGYSGKDKIQWRDKVNSRSFKVETEEVKESKEVKENKETKRKRSKGEKSKSEKSKCEDSLKEPLEEILESSNKDIKEKISQIVEEAEAEVLQENEDIVEDITLSVENEEVDEARLSEDECENKCEDLICEEVEVVESDDLEESESSDYDEQLQRNDSEYIDSYSEDGMAFKHYEEEINLQNADINYAENMTYEEECNEESNINDIDDYRVEDEELLYDAPDIVAQSIENTPTILSRAMNRANIDRSKLCHDIKVDLDKLEREVEKQVKRVLQRELEKYKKVVLKHVCKKEHHSDKKHKHHHEETCEQIHVEKKCGDLHSHQGHHHNKKCNDHHDNECDATHEKKGYANVLHNILAKHEEISINGARDCRFWKVHEHDKFPNKDSSMYPYYSAIHHLKMTYPYINYIKYFRLKGHYFFGMKYDRNSEVKYLIYGIEGDKKENHQPYKGMTGFVSWVPHGDSGIWLMYYNPYTGCIMLPKAKDKK